MKQWEYCQAYNDVRGRTRVDYFLPRQQIQQKDIETAINNLGLEGWELVSVWNGVWYFKREVLKQNPSS